MELCDPVIALGGICDAIVSLEFVLAVNQSAEQAFFTGIWGSNEPPRTEKGWRIWLTRLSRKLKEMS